MPRHLSPPLLVAILAAVLGLAGCKPKQNDASEAPAADRVVAVASVEPFAPVVGRYTGVVGARVESGLGFRVLGKIVQRLVDTGQAVKPGQVLMRIDPTDYTHALTAQAGNVAAARARWAQAAADERRNRGLAATGAISKSAYDQVKAASDSARALLDAATAQERVAGNQEDYAILLADSDGTIMEVLAEPGQVVAPGQVVLRLAHAGPREAVVDLSETIRPPIGSAATASLYGGTTTVPASLRQLSDSADPRTRTFEARFVMQGEGANAPLGATVTIELGNSGVPGLLGVPLAAIDDEGHGPGVWIVDSRTLQVAFRPVRVHSIGSELAAVSGDLAPGETVVATGGHTLREGEKVRRVVLRAAMQ